jgi:hypothetical protein
MNRRKRTPILGALALAVIALGASVSPVRAQTVTAQTAAASDPFAALPESQLVLVFDTQRILREAAPRILASDQKTLLQMNTGINGVKAMTGIDMSAIRRVLVAVPKITPNMKPQDFRGIFIVDGLDTDKLLALIRKTKAGQFTEEDYQGKTIFGIKKPEPGQAGEAATSPIPGFNQEVTLAALEPSTLVFGTAAEVRASIDASAGRVPRASGELIEAASRYPSSLASIALVLPPEMFSSMTDMPKSGKDETDVMGQAILSSLSSLKMVHGALGMTPTGYDVQAGVRLTSGEQAKAFGDALMGMQTLALMQEPKGTQDKMMHDLLDRIKISSMGEEVHFRMEMTQAALDDFMRSVRSKAADKEISVIAPVVKPTPKSKRAVRRTTRRTTRH